GARPRARRNPNLFVVVAAGAAVATLVAALPSFPAEPALLAFVGLSVVFRLVTIEVHGRGRATLAGVGLLATGFTLGTPAAVAAGPLAYAVTAAYHAMGLGGLAAVGAAPAVLAFAGRRYAETARDADAEIRRTSEELRVANDELAARTADLQALLRVAGGLAA